MRFPVSEMVISVMHHGQHNEHAARSYTYHVEDHSRICPLLRNHIEGHAQDYLRYRHA
jgi:hypothetical protein